MSATKTNLVAAQSPRTPKRNKSECSTPKMVSRIRTPATTGSKTRTPRTTRSPASCGKMRHYTKPTLIYRPLELDTESSSESFDDLFRHRTSQSRAKKIREKIKKIKESVKENKEENREESRKEMTSAVKLPTFVPGACNIEEIMRLYGTKK